MNNIYSTILKAGLIVGTLDILAACIHFYIKTEIKNVLVVFRYIASAFFGNDAFSGGNGMILFGLIMHYLIAFSFTIFFFWIFPRIKLLSTNLPLTGTAYGILIWAIMNLIVVPLSRIQQGPVEISNVIINIIILTLCIGIPLAYLANSYYKKNISPVIS